MDTLKDFSDYALNQGWCVDGESTQNGFLFYNAQTNERWIGWQAAKSQAIPEGFVLVANNSKTVVSIEKMVEQQVEASGITQDIFRLDGGRILEAMIEAQEQGHE